MMQVRRRLEEARGHVLDARNAAESAHPRHHFVIDELDEALVLLDELLGPSLAGETVSSKAPRPQ
jgi:hypothetical protein